MELKNKISKHFYELDSRMVLWVLLLTVFVYLRFIVFPIVENQEQVNSEINQLSKSIRSEDSLTTSINNLQQVYEQQTLELNKLKEQFFYGSEGDIRLRVSRDIEAFTLENNILVSQSSWQRVNQAEGSVNELKYSMQIRPTSNQFVKLLQFVEYHQPLFYVSSLRLTPYDSVGRLQVQIVIAVPFYKEGAE